MPVTDSPESETDAAAPRSELSSYHCGTCDKSVTSYGRGVACKGCSQWFHVDCQSIGDSYDQLGASDIVWKCLVCDCANYSTTAFDLHASAEKQRYHPYDEVSDDQLTENRRQTRSHPYDEITDEQLEQNRRAQRIHPYDEVSDADLAENRAQQPKSGKSNRTAAKPRSSAENELNYIEVDVQPRTADGVHKFQHERVVYSEVRLSN